MPRIFDRVVLPHPEAVLQDTPAASTPVDDRVLPYQAATTTRERVIVGSLRHFPGQAE